MKSFNTGKGGAYYKFLFGAALRSDLIRMTYHWARRPLCLWLTINTEDSRDRTASSGAGERTALHTDLQCVTHVKHVFTVTNTRHTIQNGIVISWRADVRLYTQTYRKRTYSRNKTYTTGNVVNNYSTASRWKVKMLPRGIGRSTGKLIPEAEDQRQNFPAYFPYSYCSLRCYGRRFFFTLYLLYIYYL